MSQQNTPGSGDARASGKHQGLHQPADDNAVADDLDNVGLKDSSATLEDELRDSRSKGVRGGYDDSIDKEAGDGPVTDEQVAQAPRKT